VGAWIPALAALSFLVGAAAAGLVLRYERGTRFPPGSTHRSDGRGLRALYLLLEETGHRPRRLTRAVPPPGALLVMAEPPAVSHRDRDDALLAWVSEGGELLLVMAGASLPGEHEDDGEDQPPAPSDTKKKAASGEPPRAPLAERLGLRAGAEEVWGGPMEDSPCYALGLADELAKQHFTHWPRAARVLLGGAEAPVMLEVKEGQGRIVALADPRFLDNEGLARGDHLSLALYLTAGGDRPILFDELVHGVGERAGLAYVLSRYGLLPTAFAALVFLALLAWRTGSPESPRPEGEASSPDVRDSLVEARALLYSRALRPRDAVELVERDLRRMASMTLGARRLLSWEELDERVRERKPALLGRFRSLRQRTLEHRRRPPARLLDVVPYAKSAAHLLEEMR
jgi:hypothetical protein